MADQPKDPAKKRPSIRSRAPEDASAAQPAPAPRQPAPTPESSAANAALALAVMTARKASGEAPSAAAPKAAWALPAGIPAPVRAHAAQAAMVAVALALGWFAGSRGGSAPEAAPAWAEMTQGLVRQSQEDVTRLSGDVRSLKVAVEAARESLDKAKDAGKGLPAERLDRSERLAGDAVQRLAKVAEQLDRMERAERDPARFAALTERLDRLERQTAAIASEAARPALVQAAAPQPEPMQTASLQAAPQPQASPPAPAPPIAAAPEPKSQDRVQDRVAERGPDPKAETKGPDPRAIPLEGWILREVYDGVALIEGRNKRLVEVAPGQNLPGVGRVEAIERRGKAWFVITQKGFIGADRWW